MNITKIISVLSLLILVTACGGGGGGGDIPTVTLDSISVSPATPVIDEGTSQSFTATGNYSDGSSQDITTSVTWSSSDNAIATIDGTGQATGVSAGSVTITATDGAVNGTATLGVVMPNAILNSVSITPSTANITVGDIQVYTATGNYSDGSTQDITGTVSWTSSATGMATINSIGEALGVAAGNVTITASLGGVTNTASLTVDAIPVTLDSITLAPMSPTIEVGQTQNYLATGHYSDGSSQDLTGSASWSSSDVAVATINSSAQVTAVAQGTTTIAASFSGVSGSTSLTVIPATVPLYSIDVTVSGLTGNNLILQNNQGDDLQIDLDGVFSFSTQLADTSLYNVSVLQHPDSAQFCAVTNGQGAIAGADVNNIDINCIDADELASNMYVTDKNVNSIALSADRTSVYIGGDFQEVGPNTGRAASIDINSAAAAPNFPRVAGVVYASAADGNGGWYIGGEFNSVGGIARINFAHILADGTVDPNVDLVPDDIVYALNLDNNILYIGGAFFDISGNSRPGIAAFDTGSDVLTGWKPLVNGTVRAIAVTGTTVYIGGDFTQVDSQTRNNLAAIDATLETGNVLAWDPNADDRVNVLTLSGNTVYVGGWFAQVGTMNRNYLAAVTADTGSVTAWDPSPSNGAVRREINAIVVDGNTIYVAGNFAMIGGVSRNDVAALDATMDTNNALAWDAKIVSVRIKTLLLSGNTLYVGGNFSDVNSIEQRHLAALDTTQDNNNLINWNPRVNDQVHTLALTGDNLLAAGAFTSVGGVTRNNIAEIDIASGQVTDWNPDADSDVFSLAVNGDTVYVGGDFGNIGGQDRNYIAALATTVNTNNAMPWNPDANGGVNTLTLDGATIYAGGEFTVIGGQPRSNLAQLDLNLNSNNATDWRADANGIVRSIVVTNASVYVGGDFTSIGGLPRNYIAEIDKNSGIVQGRNPDAQSRVYTMVLDGNLLYVGGRFNNISEMPRNYIASLDLTTDDGNATSWDPGSTGPSVNAIALYKDKVLAGGAFDGIGGQLRPRLGQLEKTIDTGNATAWNPAPNSEVNSIVVLDDLVFVGGNFEVINQLSSGGIAVMSAKP